MAEQLSDIIVPFPAGKLYTAPVGTTLPADTVAVGGAWPSGWVSAGFLKDAVKTTYSWEEYEAKPLQALGAVEVRKTDESFMLETVLEEFTLDGANYAMDGAVTQTPAGSGQPGKETLTMGGKPTTTKRMWGIEGSYVDEDGATFPIRLFIWRGVASPGVELSWDKGDSLGIPIKIKALQDMTKAEGQRLFKLDKILEPAT